MQKENIEKIKGEELVIFGFNNKISKEIKNKLLKKGKIEIFNEKDFFET